MSIAGFGTSTATVTYSARAVCAANVMTTELAQAFLQENPPPDLTDEQVVAIRNAFGLTATMEVAA